ncbi:PKD domain-containing protein [Angustibacter sp. McL0619]|uniref:PKD domain-containing protein n=1 Tax=Angustibacter sp. McL0619 TaxID=3415676 RepID=UPI003CEC8A17
MVAYVRRGAIVVALALVGTVVSAPVAVWAQSPVVPLSVGDNALGQQGDGTTANRTVPGPVAISGIVEIASGRDGGYALDAQAQVWAWGANQFGKVGDGTTTNRRLPVKVLTGVESIEAGHDHAIALRQDGTVWTWGYGALGQLGLGTTANHSTPTRVPGLTDIRAVAAGRDMSFALKPDGTVLGWGNNAFGEVGDGTTTRRTSPVPVVGLHDVVQLAGGRDHGLAVTSDGSLWTWGANTYGQIGDGTKTDRHTPVKVLSNVEQVDAGAHHSIALLTDGRVMTWGRGYRGALGSGTTANRLVPTAVAGLPPVVDVGDARDATFAVTPAGKVWAWGANGSGQLGDGTTFQRLSPVLLAVSGIAHVEGGALHAIFLPAGAGGNQPPQAGFEPTCHLLDCTFDASSSADPDGSIASYAWSFGDGDSSDLPAPAHSYLAAGSYDVALTVTDAQGAVSAPAIHRVVVTDTSSGGPVAFRAAATASVNSASVRVTVPAAVQPGDLLLLLISTSTQAAASGPSGWTLARQQLDGTDMRAQLYVRVAQAGDSGTAVTTAFASRTKAIATMLAYSGADGTAPLVIATADQPGAATTTHASPPLTVASAGSWVLSYWSAKDSATTAWTAPAGQTTRASVIGAGSGRVTSIATDTASPVPTGPWPGLSATASAASAKVTSWSIVLTPVS